jgi:glycosyltransferase involved in cell wall biosynthesis
LLQLTPEERARIEFSHWGTALPDPDSHCYERELGVFVQQNGLETRVHFRGTTASVADRLREADWFVLPSTNEPCSVALIEAMALGLPALVSNSGGNVDIVRSGKTGLLFEPDNPADLAAKLRAILQSEFDRLPATQIRDSVRVRSATAVAQQYMSLYEQLARHDPARKSVRRSESLPSNHPL